MAKKFCENIKNDCLDISGGIVEGDKLYSKAVYDKGLSFGENSKGSIQVKRENHSPHLDDYG